jgi:hypothetical protein
MPKNYSTNEDDKEVEEVVIIKTCCNCYKDYTHKNQRDVFKYNRKIPKGKIDVFNRLMTKPRKKLKKSDEILCDQCYIDFFHKLQVEKRALDKKLDMECEKNDYIRAEGLETEEGEFKEDGTLTDTFLKAIAGNLLFQIQISKN